MLEFGNENKCNGNALDDENNMIMWSKIHGPIV